MMSHERCLLHSCCQDLLSERYVHMHNSPSIQILTRIYVVYIYQAMAERRRSIMFMRYDGRYRRSTQKDNEELMFRAI